MTSGIYLEHIKPPDWDRIVESDLVCFSSLNAGADKTYELSNKIRAQLGIPTIIGGTHATYFPESCLEHCDYVVLGEGDETIIDSVNILESGGDLETVSRSGLPGWRRGTSHFSPQRSGKIRHGPGSLRSHRSYRRLTWLDTLIQRRVLWILRSFFARMPLQLPFLHNQYNVCDGISQSAISKP